MLKRLFQPAKPAFWFVLVLNALSMALVWLAQTPAISTVASIVIVLFALGNAGLGAFFTWQLWRTHHPTQAADSS
jgi:hypothetical protein